MDLSENNMILDVSIDQLTCLLAYLYRFEHVFCLISEIFSGFLLPNYFFANMNKSDTSKRVALLIPLSFFH